MSLWNDLVHIVFDGVGLAGFKSRANAFLFSLRCSIPLLFYTILTLLFFLSIGWYCGAGVFILIGCVSLSLSLALPTSFNNNNYNEGAYLLSTVKVPSIIIQWYSLIPSYQSLSIGSLQFVTHLVDPCVLHYIHICFTWHGIIKLICKQHIFF